MDAKIITLPLEKVKLRPLADGLVNLQEAKEAYKLRGQSYETGKAMGIVGDSYKMSVSQEKYATSGKVYTLPIAVQTTAHNHPMVVGNLSGYNSTFSATDLNSHLYKTNTKAVVSTRDCLFFFNDKNKKNIFHFLMEATPIQGTVDIINLLKWRMCKNQIKGLLKNKNNVIEYDNNINNYILSLNTQAQDQVKDNIGKRDQNQLDDFMHSELERISKKVNWVYKRYTWEELFPNVIRSRGKK